MFKHNLPVSSIPSIQFFNWVSAELIVRLKRERDGEKRSLTEPAVDDFAARCCTDLAHLTGTSAQRTALQSIFKQTTSQFTAAMSATVSSSFIAMRAKVSQI
jgi:hypothetical protein